MQLPANVYVIKVKEVETARGEIRPDMLLVMDPAGNKISPPGKRPVSFPSACQPCGSARITARKRCSVITPWSIRRPW